MKHLRRALLGALSLTLAATFTVVEASDIAPAMRLEEGGCGNGIIDQGEPCDDGNQNNHDGCRNNCSVINYVENPSFDDGTTGWFSTGTERFREIFGELEVELDCTVALCLKGGPPTPQVLTILEEHLEGDQYYRLAFTSQVIADAPRLIGTWGRVDLFKDTERFERFWEWGLEEPFYATTNPRTHYFVFKTSSDGRYLPEPRLAFFFRCPAREYVCEEKSARPAKRGRFGARLRLDNFSLEKILARCGDGIVQIGEECDPKFDSHCTPKCQIPRLCGNGVVDPGEQCDDSGVSATCDRDCTWSVCGDRTLNPLAGEWCDDGDDVNVDLCLYNCQSNPNVVQNGDFSQRMDWWAVWPQTISFGFEREKSSGLAARLRVPAGGGILRQSGLILKGNTRYKLTFDAWNDLGSDMRVQLFMNRPPHTDYGLNEFVNVERWKQTFHFYFTTPDVGAINDARLTFKFANRDVLDTDRIQRVVIEETN